MISSPDIILSATSILAAAYCILLSRRIKRLNDLKSGLGSAIILLTEKTETLTKSLNHSNRLANEKIKALEGAIQRAEITTRNLKLNIASMHDIPQRRESENWGKRD